MDLALETPGGGIARLMRNAHLLIIVKRDSTEKVDFVSMAGVGGPREDRTPNPLIKSQLLCQLSYRPEELIAGIS